MPTAASDEHRQTGDVTSTPMVGSGWLSLGVSLTLVDAGIVNVALPQAVGDREVGVSDPCRRWPLVRVERHAGHEGAGQAAVDVVGNRLSAEW